LIRRRKRQKTKVKDPKADLIFNHKIKAPELRLVGDNLDEISQVAGYNVTNGIYNTRTLQQWADELDKDLIVIAPKANPPVAKIMDLNKYLYEQKKRKQAQKSHSAKTVVKELRFGPNTDEHDFEFKVNHARKFLEEGNKVRAYVQFKGRTIIFKENGELLLLRFAKALEDIGTIESLPQMKGNRRMVITIMPKKKGKKSTGA